MYAWNVSRGDSFHFFDAIPNDFRGKWEFKLDVNSFHDLDFADFIIRLDMALSFLQFIKLVSAGCLLKI